MMAFLSDDILIRILRLMLDPADRKACALTCKRWMIIAGTVRNSIRINDWSFVEKGRIHLRFPNLTEIDLTSAWTSAPDKLDSSSAIIPIVNTNCVMWLGNSTKNPFTFETAVQDQGPSPRSFHRGLELIGGAYPGLQRLQVVDILRPLSDDHVAVSEEAANQKTFRSKGRSCEAEESSGTDILETEAFVNERAAGNQDVLESDGLQIIAKACPMLQELEVRQCTDQTLTALAECRNIQILRLVGGVKGFYHATFTDQGLVHLACKCRRLVELGLKGCTIGYKGLSAIGDSCQMLSELTLAGGMFKAGWLRALKHCAGLQTLSLQSLRGIEVDNTPQEELGHCKSLARLQILCCDMRNKAGLAALLMICESVKELEYINCWGLVDQIFSVSSSCRCLRRLSLEGCSLVTVTGLEEVLVACKDLQALRVSFCNAIRDADMSPNLSHCIFGLKELRWGPNSEASKALSGLGILERGRWLLPHSNLHLSGQLDRHER